MNLPGGDMPEEHSHKAITMGDQLSEAQVSEYLKANQEFLLRWLGENATTEIVEQFAKILRDKRFDGTPPNSAGGTGLRVTLPTFSQVAKNSITSSIFRRYLDGDRTRKVSVKKDRSVLKRMTEEELFMELIRDIASELDVNLLCHKILQNVSILTNSDRGSLFLVRGSRDNRHLVSKLFDVTETSTVEDSVHTERNEIRVPFGKGIVGLVAQTGRHINIKNAYSDPRFNQEIDKQTGYRTHSILSMPIVNYEGEVIGVAQIINKIDGNHEFTKQDEELFRKYLIFCGIGITNAQLFEMSVNEFRRNQLLLHLARGIFEEQTNLEKLVQKIMLDAQDLLKCEKCSVYLLEDTLEHDIARFTHTFMSRLGSYSRNTLVMAMQDPSSTRESGDVKPRGSDPIPKPKNAEEVTFSKAFDLCAKDGTVTVMSASDLATSKTAYIAKFVVITEEPVNVADVSADGRFGKGPFKDAGGCEITSVLCMPIHNSERRIIGVTQLINKVNGEPFDDNDVNIIEAFSIFTGLGIHNCQMYENACQLMAKQSVALEVLSYHAAAPSEEASTLARSKIPTSDQLRLREFDFDDLHMGDDGTLKACVRMFMDADCINRFKVPYLVVCRWLCTVKKNYRPVTYHNWRHAFNVAQTMFTILFSGGLRPLFDELEVYTLLVACLCHDLDHRGTNNAFQVKVASPLAMLYSTSVLEHHHFDHCIMILNSEGNNIFQSLSPEEYKRAIKLMEHAILSTDLALYFKKRGDFKKLVETGEKNFVEPHKRALLRAMMMTACDVGAITKPWHVQQQVALLVTAEFFEQGDIERSQLGEQPIPMMDRNKKDELPKMQVGFIDAICTPIYKLFAIMTEKLEPLHTGCENNRRKWLELSEQKEADNVTETPQQQPQPQPQPQQQQSASVTETAEESPAQEKPVHHQAVTDKAQSEQDQQPSATSNSNDSSSNNGNQQTQQAPLTARPASLHSTAPPPSEQHHKPSSHNPQLISQQPQPASASQPATTTPSNTDPSQKLGPSSFKDSAQLHSDAKDQPDAEPDLDPKPAPKVAQNPPAPRPASDTGDPSTALPPSGSNRTSSAHPGTAESHPSSSHPSSAHSHLTSEGLPTPRAQPDGRESLRTKPDGHSDIASASTTRRLPDTHQHQMNGSVVARQVGATTSDMRHKHQMGPSGDGPSEKQQVRGKRKTLAQAEQTTNEKSGGKSGVCHIS